MNNFDERQLWIRGNIFKHALIILACLISIDTLIDIDGERVFGYLTGVVCIMITTMICGIEMIHKDAYETKLGKNKAVGIFLAVCGLLLLIIRGTEIISGRMSYGLPGGKEYTGLAVISMCLCIYGSYYIYHAYRSKNKNEEDA